jgi:hypothetical protein
VLASAQQKFIETKYFNYKSDSKLGFNTVIIDADKPGIKLSNMFETE